MPRHPKTRPPSTALKWPLYVYEALELAIFMLSACVFTVILFHPNYPALKLIPSPILRRPLMGIAMGLTAIAIIHSPMGKRSGAHFNPSITLTYFRLGKIQSQDALAELFMAALLMGVVLWTSNRPRIAPYTSYCVGILIMFYIILFAPVSGFSINPARTVGSAVFAQVFTALWLYFLAPILGMLLSAELYLRSYGEDRILCAKLHPDPDYPCPFLCHFPNHRHPTES